MLLKPSLENISRQSGDLFHDLTEAFRKLRKAEQTQESINKSYLSQIVKRHTGLNIRFNLSGKAVDGNPYEMGIYPSGINPGNHVLMDLVKTDVRAKYDLKKGKVSGAFSEIVSNLFIGENYIWTDLLTEEELSAVTIHEVGHAFFSLVYSTTILYYSTLCTQTAHNVLNSDSVGEREIIFKKLSADVGMKQKGYTTDMLTNPKPGLEVFLFGELMTTIYNMSDNAWYDVRNVEQLADTFAVKHGASAHLADALQKIYQFFGVLGKNSFISHLLTEMGRCLRSLGDISYIMISMQRNGKVYDDPKERVIFIKRQLVEDLKSIPSNNKELRNQIIEEIEYVDNVIQNFQYRRDFVSYWFETFDSVGRSITKREKSRKQLEELMYNDLFYASAKFKQLGDR